MVAVTRKFTETIIGTRRYPALDCSRAVNCAGVGGEYINAGQTLAYSV